MRVTHTFDELTNKAKQNALCKYAEPHDDWWDSTYDWAKIEGELVYGFEVDDIRFSGFCSQGDGASWTGRVRAVHYLDYKLKDMKPDDECFGAYTVLREIVENGYLMNTIEISRGGGMYVHEQTMRAEADSSGYGSTDPEEWGEMVLTNGVLTGAKIADLMRAYDFDHVLNSLIDDALDDARTYAQEIYSKLEQEYDYLTSETNLKETADANGWRFDEDGDLV